MINSEYIIPQPKLPPEDRFNLQIDKNGVYLVSEEAGTLWIWAYPGLLDWPLEIAWLFPKVSNDGPGDLWGVDASGDLIIVETKKSTIKRRLQDPFEDFLKESPLIKDDLLNPDILLEKWDKLLKNEIEWIQNGCRTPKGVARGVIPYSYHRFTILRWFDFYTSQIIPRLTGVQYPEAVCNFMQRRKDRDNPSHHFIGLYTVTHLKKPGLSRKGRSHYKELALKVGTDRIHQRAVRCMNLGNGKVIIESVDIEPDPQRDSF